MSETGTFLSKDPWKGDYLRPLSLNGWSYVEGNPINRVDPTEQCSEYAPRAAPIAPTSARAQELISSLDRTWLVGQADYKQQQCCDKEVDPCGCIPRKLRPVSLPVNYTQFGGDPDGYMRYWLAWEKLNPCCYRAHANCMGAALEVSYLYTSFGDFAEYIDGSNGFADPRNWGDFLGKGYFTLKNFFSTTALGVSSVIYFQPSDLQPGDILTYEPQGMLALLGESIFGGVGFLPTHMVVVTNHSASGERLCFEKQSPGNPKGRYYQLKQCNNRSGHPATGELPFLPAMGHNELHYTPDQNGLGR